jgi:hypothetical protein
MIEIIMVEVPLEIVVVIAELQEAQCLIMIDIVLVVAEADLHGDPKMIVIEGY